MPTDPPVRPLSAEEREQAIVMLEWAIPRFALGPVAKFEQDAEEFYRETGHMAPGKSLPLEMCPSDDDARQAAWKTWTDARQARWIAVLHTAIAALRWGHLTGAGGLRLSEDEAVAVQTARGQALVDAINGNGASDAD